MHHLIQRGKVRSQVINVPEGFPEILSDITREVLRCQPTTECLCQFIIDYLHSVIVARDKARIAKSIIDRALRIVDELIADMCICEIPKEKADYMCEAMEECFRRFLAQRRCEKEKTKEVVKFREFDMLDELIQKCKFTDYELKISKPVIEEAYKKFVNAYMTARENSDGTDSLYRYFREREVIRMEERLKEESAVKIQALFRGFLVRKSLFMGEGSKLNITEEMEIDKELLEMAALKIQKFFRNHMIDLREAEAKKGGLQDPCSPASNLSLTARPVGHHDLIEESDNVNQPEQNKDENVKIPEVTPDKNDDLEQIELNKTGEVAAEAEISNEVAAEAEISNEVAAETEVNIVEITDEN